MAHFIKLHMLDMTHDNQKSYVPILFNLDTVVSIEPSPSGTHSMVLTHGSVQPIKIRESLDEILTLSKSCVKSVITG